MTITGMYNKWQALHLATESACSIEQGKSIVTEMVRLQVLISNTASNCMGDIIIKLTLATEVGEMHLVESALLDLNYVKIAAE